jgi:hypothetical protein
VDKTIRDIFDVLVPGYISGRQDRQVDFAECRLCSPPHFRNYFELTVPREHPSQAELMAAIGSKTQRVENSCVVALIDHYGWDTAISALETKVKSETDPKVIGPLTSALWYADNRRLREKGPGAALLPTSGIGVLTVLFLQRIAVERREQILRDAWTTSDHFGLFYRVVAAEQFSARQSDRKHEPILPSDTLRRLRRESVAEAKKVLGSETVMQDPMLIWLLAYNSQAEGPESVFSWTRSLLSDRTKLAGFLCNVIRVNRQEDPKEKLELNRGVLGAFFAIDSSLLEATKDTAGLSGEYAEVIQQANAIAVAATKTGHTTSAPNVGEFPSLLALMPDLI